MLNMGRRVAHCRLRFRRHGSPVVCPALAKGGMRSEAAQEFEFEPIGRQIFVRLPGESRDSPCRHSGILKQWQCLTNGRAQAKWTPACAGVTRKHAPENSCPASPAFVPCLLSSWAGGPRQLLLLRSLAGSAAGNRATTAAGPPGPPRPAGEVRAGAASPALCSTSFIMSISILVACRSALADLSTICVTIASRLVI